MKLLDNAKSFQYEAQLLEYIRREHTGAEYLIVVTNSQRFTAIFPLQRNKSRYKQLAKDGFYVVREEHLKDGPISPDYARAG